MSAKTSSEDGEPKFHKDQEKAMLIRCWRVMSECETLQALKGQVHWDEICKRHREDESKEETAWAKRKQQLESTTCLQTSK